MKKKSTKNKMKKPEIAQLADENDIMMAHVDDDDDVAEDYKVIDMSDIPAPVIEFEMPNLNERKIEETEKTVGIKKSGKKTLKKHSDVSNSENSASNLAVNEIPLTAEKLNNELVGLRAVILKAKNQLMSKLVRQKKQLEAKKERMEGKIKEDTERKVARLVEEIMSLKTIDKDTISKFAALNTKTLEQLKIDGNTPVTERIMYKLVCQTIVVEKVELIKKKYTEWNKTAAFFMQRLGQQYSNKSEKRSKESAEKIEDIKNTETNEISECEEEDNSDGASFDEEYYSQLDVEMVDSEEESDAAVANNRRKLLLGLIGVEEDKTRSSLKPKKRKMGDTDGLNTGNDKKINAKETAKNELKSILEKELKTKEVKIPKKLKKTKTPRKTKPSHSVKETDQRDVTEVVNDPITYDDSQQSTLVLKVDLSKGGKIAKPEKAATSLPVAINTISKSRESDEDDSDSTPFFLQKTDSEAQKDELLSKTVKSMKITKKRKEIVQDKKAGTYSGKNSIESQAAPPVPEKKKRSSKTSSKTGEIHPSWIASQLKKKELAAAKPCGKKITFSDDDD